MVMVVGFITTNVPICIQCLSPLTC
jgi:hypothetical protein